MSIEDARVQFYLKHREQLAEWFELRAEVAAALDEWFADLAPHLEALCAELPGAVEALFEADESETWPGLFLRRPSWSTDAQHTPRVGIQWTRGKILLVGSNAPWVGVHAERKRPLGRALYGSEAFQAVRRARKDLATAWWASYRPLKPELPFPEQADEYRAQAVEAIKSAWMAYAPVIDEVFSNPIALSTDAEDEAPPL